MITKKLKQFFIFIASASAVAAINYTVLHNPFVFVILIILFAHELGHYMIAKINKVQVDFPYFIPIPIFSIGITHIKNMSFLPVVVRKKILMYGPITGFLTSFHLFIFSLIFFPSLALPFLFVSFYELFFNYFGSDGKKYRQIEEKDLSLCIL